jgi:AraC-like DNA-binding protein
MYELTDESIPVSAVFGQKGDVLQAEIAQAASCEEAIRLLAGFLVTNKNTRPGTQLVSEITKDIITFKGDVRIADLSARYRYSNRYIEKLFREKVGIHPKLFSRITRLQHTVKSFANCPPAQLTRLACQSDYFDQSHFIRDFKDLAGITPREYLAENHLLSDFLTGS